MSHKDSTKCVCFCKNVLSGALWLWSLLSLLHFFFFSEEISFGNKFLGSP